MRDYKASVKYRPARGGAERAIWDGDLKAWNRTAAMSKAMREAKANAHLPWDWRGHEFIVTVSRQT